LLDEHEIGFVAGPRKSDKIFKGLGLFWADGYGIDPSKSVPLQKINERRSRLEDIP
jgi:hypothetical protein